MIEIIDPCLDPFSLTVQSQTSPDAYFYTGASPRLEFTPFPASVDPPICPIFYSCLTTPQNLCQLADGATSAQFTQSTGRYTFSSIDTANYPPGMYTLTITATSGAKSEPFAVQLELIDPCFTVDLGQKPSPFNDATYVLRDPPAQQVWQVSQLIDPQTQVDCGPVTVEFFNADASKTPIDSTLFVDDRSGDPVLSFNTLESQDTSKRGAYPIGYKVFHAGYPDNFVEVSPAFTITVTN